jgi:hypothetical protein
MARPSDPERIETARREGVKARLAAEMGKELADAWLTAWEAEAGGRTRDGDYWDGGYQWITAQRRTGRRTPG